MEISVKRRKFLYYRNVLFSGAASAYIAFNTYHRLHTNTFGLLDAALAVFLVINCLVVISAVKEIRKKTYALVINDEGITDNVSPANMGLIPWEAVADCELRKYRGYIQLLLVLHQPDLALAKANMFNRPIIKRAITQVGTGVFINTDVLDYNRELLRDAILQRLGKVHLEQHLVSN